ncbi:NAD(P)-dependent oxidoreductase [Bacillus pacificus]|uniref:NAD-dependent epimerase/dehydratase family protein n=1 Tax=Bacillus pacificus TaxID=2026187 RepID=UPI002E23FB92|nr:NAD(P)-dependent oxidoreductase [Bacillus pacificus]
MLMKKTVLVTGANGFIGKEMVGYLVGEGYTVVGQSRFGGITSQGVIPYVSNLMDKEEIVSLIIDYQISSIIHLAGPSNVNLTEIDFVEGISILDNLLSAIKHVPNKPLLILASSSKVYDDREDGPVSEHDQVNPSTLYGKYKVCCEDICRWYYNTYDIPLVILRFANVFGKGDHNKSRLVPSILTALYDNEVPSILSNGEGILDFIYIEDVIECIVYLIKLVQLGKSDIVGQVLNLGGGCGITTHKVIDTIVTMYNQLHNEHAVYNLGTRKSSQNLTLSMNNMEKFTGWFPKYSFDYGIYEIIKV